MSISNGQQKWVCSLETFYQHQKLMEMRRTIKNRGIDLTKVLPIIKQHLSKLENQIFPNQNMHYILLDSDFDSVYVNLFVLNSRVFIH